MCSSRNQSEEEILPPLGPATGAMSLFLPGIQSSSEAEERERVLLGAKCKEGMNGVEKHSHKQTKQVKESFRTNYYIQMHSVQSFTDWLLGVVLSRVTIEQSLFHVFFLFYTLLFLPLITDKSRFITSVA